MQDCEDALSVFREGSASEVTEPRGKTVRITDAAQECIRNLRNDVTKMSDDLHTFSILNSGLPEALKLMNSSLSLLKVLLIWIGLDLFFFFLFFVCVCVFL